MFTTQHGAYRSRKKEKFVDGLQGVVSEKRTGWESKLIFSRWSAASHIKVSGISTIADNAQERGRSLRVNATATELARTVGDDRGGRRNDGIDRSKASDNLHKDIVGGEANGAS